MKTMRMVVALVALGAAVGGVPAAALPAHADQPAPRMLSCLKVPDDVVWESIAPFTILPCDEVHNADVYNLAVYPDDLGKPSEVQGRLWEIFSQECSYAGLRKWLGAGSIELPVRIRPTIRIPSDDDWATGARWVACTASRVTDRSAATYKGTLPKLFASTPLLGWLWCPKGTPKSGQWNVSGPCTPKMKWLLINGGQLKGKIGPDYPRDVQAKADAVCAKRAKPLLTSGAKSKAFAALGAKQDFPNGDPFFDCFIALSDWNGKGH